MYITIMHAESSLINLITEQLYIQRITTLQCKHVNASKSQRSNHKNACAIPVYACCFSSFGILKVANLLVCYN